MNVRSARLLDRFAGWFASGPGVWQTAFLTTAVVIVELSDTSLDPHAFLLMAVLTVYSAVTQPALAYSGAVQGRRTDALLERMIGMEERMISMEQRLLDKIGDKP